MKLTKKNKDSLALFAEKISGQRINIIYFKDRFDDCACWSFLFKDTIWLNKEWVQKEKSRFRILSTITHEVGHIKTFNPKIKRKDLLEYRAHLWAIEHTTHQLIKKDLLNYIKECLQLRNDKDFYNFTAYKAAVLFRERNPEIYNSCF